MVILHHAQGANDAALQFAVKPKGRLLQQQLPPVGMAPAVPKAPAGGWPLPRRQHRRTVFWGDLPVKPTLFQQQVAGGTPEDDLSLAAYVEQVLHLAVAFPHHLMEGISQGDEFGEGGLGHPPHRHQF